MMTVRRRALLCAPSSKRVTAGERRVLPIRNGLARLDHFACYRAAPEGARRRHVVRLADQFQGGPAETRAAETICNPAGIAGPRPRAVVGNAAAHLVGYRAGGPAPRRIVRVSNRFGPGQRLVTGRGTRLLVPTHSRICLTIASRSKPPLVAGGRRVGTVTGIAITPFGGDPRGACPA